MKHFLREDPLTVGEGFYSTYEELKLCLKWKEKRNNASFYSTYEELKPVFIILIITFKISFLQYLWGIETWVAGIIDKIISGFYSTYEELKLLIMIQGSCLGNLFLQYLWGIETKKILPVKWSSPQVFTVPMRNWNTIFASCGLYSFIGFYSTYEELKPFFEWVEQYGSPGFYSTYEELKHRTLLYYIIKGLSFYSTYEELKLPLITGVANATA